MALKSKVKKITPKKAKFVAEKPLAKVVKEIPIAKQEPREETTPEEVNPAQSKPILNTVASMKAQEPMEKPPVKAPVATPAGSTSPDLVERDASMINARIIAPVNSVIGRKRYVMEKGKVYKISRNVYDVLKNANKVL